jgi:hypothetical protein
MFSQFQSVRVVTAPENPNFDMLSVRNASIFCRRQNSEKEIPVASHFTIQRGSRTEMTVGWQSKPALNLCDMAYDKIYEQIQ